MVSKYLQGEDPGWIYACPVHARSTPALTDSHNPISQDPTQPTDTHIKEIDTNLQHSHFEHIDIDD